MKRKPRTYALWDIWEPTPRRDSAKTNDSGIDPKDKIDIANRLHEALIDLEEEDDTKPQFQCYKA